MADNQVKSVSYTPLAASNRLNNSQFSQHTGTNHG